VAGTEVEAVKPITAREMYEVLRDETKQQVLEPEVVAEMISDRILSAPTVGAVLTGSVMAKGKDYLGVPTEVSEVRWMHSSIEGGTGVYAVVEGVRLDTGEPMQYAAGGRTCLAQLYRLGELDAYPLQLVLREATRPSARGYFAQWYEAVPS